MKKVLRKNEFYIFLTILFLALIVEIRSGQFFTNNNIVDITRTLIVPAILTIGAFIVIVSGGIDVSFTAIASLSMYVTTKILIDIGYEGTVFLPFIMSAVLGFILGAFNGFIIVRFKISTLIVTLGTMGIFSGIMLGVLKSREFPVIPKPMDNFGRASLLTVRNPESGLTSALPVAIFILIGIFIITFFILRYTIWGRGIYAIGGDENSARIIGLKVDKIKFFVYCFAGMIAGIAGMVRACMMLVCHPTNLIGMELTVIAAVVLGGASITGGRGTLISIMLGISLLTIIGSSLLLLGIPTYWQQFVVGIFIIVGTGISESRSRGLKNI